MAKLLISPIHFPGLAIGHQTYAERKTGLSVLLFDKPVVCGRWLCGAAPATRDNDLLSAENLVDHIDALLFTGGSAFGLDAAAGVMQWLREHDRGWPTDFGRVPIVPAAAIYDWREADVSPPAPSAWDGYTACGNAVPEISLYGAVGAGTGARVGKLLSHTTPDQGGLGIAKITAPDGLMAIAVAVVNSAGDIYNIHSENKIIAGARLSSGEFANTLLCLQNAVAHEALQTVVDPRSQHSNTTLVAVITNACFDKPTLTRIARMAGSGIAQAICPAYTSYDGDVVYCASVPELNNINEVRAGALCAETVRQAIIHAVS